MMNEFDRFAQLWTDYLEGELPESGHAELKELLGDDPAQLQHALQHYQLHRLLGFVNSPKDSHAFVQETLQRLPSESQEFVQEVLAKISIEPTTDKTVTLMPSRVGPDDSLYLRWIAVLLASAFFIALGSWAWFSKFQEHGQALAPVSHAEYPKPIQSPSVRFARTANSKFLGEYSPTVDSEVEWNREYVLTHGSVEIQFPTGAETIIDGPAVFQIVASNSLNMTMGKCSVHAPLGAEGFFVETPSARIVDRGTRFSINASESTTTEVHVVEGAADIYRHPEMNSAFLPSQPTNTAFRLNESQAVRLNSAANDSLQLIEFEARSYRSKLPDRIISYQALLDSSGGAKELSSIKIQREGIERTYLAEDLINVQLSAFRITEKMNDIRHIAGESTLSENRLDVLSDFYLNTGAINPGGDKTPLYSDPILDSDSGQIASNGFAVRFNRPVVNRPGPDVVFFELQNLIGAQDGDSFHVLPLRFTEGMKPLTITQYDLSLTSPESLKAADFFLYEFEMPVTSVQALATGPCQSLPRPHRGAGYRVLAVSIDLSRLGFEDGQQVDGLFFQDSANDENHVDPVFIAGLP